MTFDRNVSSEYFINFSDKRNADCFDCQLSSFNNSNANSWNATKFVTSPSDVLLYCDCYCSCLLQN